MPVRGSTQRLTVTFYDEPGGVIVDPTSVSWSLTLDGNPILGPLVEPVVVKDGPGLYHYDWAIPLDAELGTYVSQWSGILPGGSVPTYGYENVLVVEDEVYDVPDYDGCLWPMDPACLTPEWEALDDDVKYRAHALASSTLHRLTGRRVGVCPITVRPCKPTVACGVPYYDSPYGTFRPGMDLNGAWINSCGCTTPCGHQNICEVKLPAPVGRVDEVKVDGAVVPSTDYRVDGNMLVYTGAGDCLWPSTQDLSASDSEPNTFSVTYLNAYPVDSIGAYAAGVLALEFSKACTGGKCRLPAGVTTVIRQGVTLEITTGVFADGFTGIREVDSYIALWNPNGLQRQSTVWSPDLYTPRVVQ